MRECACALVGRLTENVLAATKLNARGAEWVRHRAGGVQVRPNPCRRGVMVALQLQAELESRTGSLAIDRPLCPTVSRG